MPYVVMNTFHVAADQAEHFEARCHRSRHSVENVPGFKAFQLLRGEARDDTIHYVAHSIWASKEALEAWTHSEGFVQARRSGSLPRRMMRGRPRLECFEVVSLTD